MKDGKFSAGDIYSLLYARYSDNREFLCAREVADSTGGGRRRLDFVACDCYSSKGFGIYAFEVKISKSDLRNELFDPSKHNVFFDCVDFYSIVAPDYVLDAEYVKVVPKQWGIIKAVAGNSDVPNRLVTYRKPLALHDERDYKMDRSFVFSLMRRLRDDPSARQTEQEIRNAEFQRGYDEGKRRCVGAEYERLFGEAQLQNDRYRRALSALGVSNAWWNIGDRLVDEAKERALKIKKYEKAYNSLMVMGHQVEALERCTQELKEVTSSFAKVKDETDVAAAESPAEILKF